MDEAEVVQRVVWLVGASGAGKTAVAETLAARPSWRGATHFFDSIGVPSGAEMETGDWGGEDWQMWATRQWMDRIAERGSALSLIEGQTRPSGIRIAAEAYPGLSLEIILLDCTPEVRRHRLIELRDQPELASHEMDCWAAYLVGQAHALGLPVVDTSKLDVRTTADRIEQLVGARWRRRGGGS